MRIFCLFFLLSCSTDQKSKVFSVENLNEELFQEKILEIGISKTVFLLSNEQNQLQEGDFITLILKNKAVCKGLVVKLKDKKVAVHMKKIYSLTYWSHLKRHLQVDIFKGDESRLIEHYFTKEKNKAQMIDQELMTTFEEEDLFKNSSNSSYRFSDQRFFYSGLAVGLDFQRNLKDELNYFPQYFFQLGFKYDYLKLENLFGLVYFSNFPIEGKSAYLLSLYPRLKAEVMLSSSFFISAFVGVKYPIYLKISDDKEQSLAEKDLFKKIEEYTVDGGLSFITRLVPGWTLEVTTSFRTFVHAGLYIEF